jgi:hypothetical protein
MGLCTHYRRFISGFAHIAKPLTRLTEQKQSFQWTPVVEAAFQTLKGALFPAPILAYPQPGESFIVETDASNFGIGGIFSQVQDGQEGFISYYSVTFHKAERNYTFIRRKLLAIVRTPEHIHKFLYGKEFHLLTDYSALTWLTNFKNPEGQTARWIHRLQEYNFTSEHSQGRKQENAYALSRRRCKKKCAHCHKFEAWTDIKQVRAIAAVASADWDPAAV